MSSKTKNDPDPGGLIRELHEGGAMQAAYLQCTAVEAQEDEYEQDEYEQDCLGAQIVTFCKHEIIRIVIVN